VEKVVIDAALAFADYAKVSVMAHFCKNALSDRKLINYR
jgi:hypothetical protein